MIHNRIAAFGCCLLLALSMISIRAKGQSLERTVQPQQNLSLRDLGNQDNQKVSTQPIVLLADGSVIQGAGSVLVRTRDNVFTSGHAQRLTPGWAVTFWMVVFNYPINCATQPCTVNDLANPAVQGSLHNIGGQVIGDDGTANFAAYLGVGDKLGVSDAGGFSVGVLNPFGAQINLVLRGHGPASSDPTVLHQQLSIFMGGCPATGCVDLERSRHQP